MSNFPVKKVLGWLFGLFLLIQLYPVNRDNPPVTEEIQVPDNIKAIFERSCYDCHSNKTKWPWYSYVAPVSWLVAGHVEDGRKNLNFTEWDKYDAKKRANKLEEILDEIEEGEMPLPGYLRLHPEAVLSGEDIDAIANWYDSLESGGAAGETGAAATMGDDDDDDDDH